MTGGWRAYVTTARTGALIQTDAVLGDFTLSDDLNEGGTLTCDLRVDDPYEALRTVQRLIWPTKDGVPFSPYLITELPRASWVGTYRPVVAVRADVALFARRTIRHTLDFNGVDQLHIYRDIIRYATNQATLYTPSPVNGGDTSRALSWLDLDSTVSAVPRIRLAAAGQAEEGYPGSARKVVGQMLSNLRALQNGFEARLRPYLVPGVGPRCEIQLGYPTVGTLPGAAAIGFEYPGNVSDPTYGEDGSEFYTRVDYLGEETNNTRPVGTAVDTASTAAGFPALETAFSESSVSGAGTLNDKAAGRLLRRVPAAWGVVLDGRRHPMFGQYGLGDHARLIIRAPGAPMVEQTVRVTGWTLTVEGRREQVVPVLQVAG